MPIMNGLEASERINTLINDFNKNIGKPANKSSFNSIGILN